MVGNADLVNAAAFLRQLSRDLGFESKPLFFDRDRLDKGGSERFIAGFDIRQVQVREHVRD